MNNKGSIDKVKHLIKLVHRELLGAMVELIHHLVLILVQVDFLQLFPQQHGLGFVQLGVDDVAAHQADPLLEQKFGEEGHHYVGLCVFAHPLVVLKIRA